VCEAVAEVVTQVWSEDLRLTLHAPKRTGVNHPIAVTLKIVAVGMRKLRVSPAPALFRHEAKWPKHGRPLWSLAAGACFIDRAGYCRTFLQHLLVVHGIQQLLRGGRVFLGEQLRQYDLRLFF